MILAMAAQVVAAQQVPSWTGPKLDPANGPWGGAQSVSGANYTRLYYATPVLGTYSHAAMIDFHYGQFLSTWKNSPTDEDSPGQSVTYSQSADGITWTPAATLFPNVSTNDNPAALFAEPALHLNSNLYAAASPKQFCLYPDQYASVLLLRRVLVPGLQQLGPLFWASTTIPAGFEEASALRNITTVDKMDPDTQADIATLADPMLLPCGPVCAEGELKCEACQNGCQDWNIALNVTGILNERTHYVVPGTRSRSSMCPRGSPGYGITDPQADKADRASELTQVDVLLYRNNKKKLYASTRTGMNGTWTTPVATNIPDDNANINAGLLPDGRIYLVSNAMPQSSKRDPLFVTTSVDGWQFNQTNVVAACNQTVFTSPQQPNGCVERYSGGSKNPGMQYPQAVAVTAPSVPQGLYVIFSVNKEDIWVAYLPFNF